MDPVISATSTRAEARTLRELTTPALLLDRRKLERNGQRMRDKVSTLGVSLRPHVKTSKSIDVLRVLAGGEDAGITVSTLAEARYFFGYGVTDILYAVGLAPVKLPEVADLIRSGCPLKVIVDTPEAADAVQTFGSSQSICIEALIEIDSDGHRAGIGPGDRLLIETAKRLTSGPGAQLAGVMTHAGSSYHCRNRDEFESMAEQERALTVKAAERLREAGSPCEMVSVGSTPTIHYARSLEGVTEARCGVYSFGDLVQAQLGTCTIEDIAIGVLASVIGHNRTHGRVLIDAGFLALSRDRSTSELPVDWGYGAVCDPSTGKLFDGLTVSGTNQEHGIVTGRDGMIDFDRFHVGKQVLVLPNHSCATAAAYDRYHVTDGGEDIVAVWDRVNGW